MKIEPAEERSKALPEVDDEGHEGPEPCLHVGSAQPSDEPGPDEKMSLLQVLGSVLWAGLGVQSSKNRERDFRQGRLLTFVLVGLFMTGCFIGTIYAIVSLVLADR